MPAHKPRMTKTMSNNKVCPRCMIFVMEIKPLFRPGGAAEFFANGGKLPETKVFCNRCHNKNLPNGDEWGWLDITAPSLKNKHIPYDHSQVRRRS